MAANFEYYKVFYYVAQSGSVTKAASLLHLTQPSVTRTIKLLENELGCILFERTKKGVILTSEGRIIFRGVEVACKKLFSVEEELDLRKRLQMGVVKISAVNMAFSDILFKAVEVFRNNYPNISLQFYHTRASEFIEKLDSGEVDIIIDYLGRIERDCHASGYSLDHISIPSHLNRDQYTIIKLKEYTDIPVAGPAYAHLAGEKTTIAELIKHPLIMSFADMKGIYQGFIQEHGHDRVPEFLTGELESRIKLAKKNFGITFLPKEYVQKDIEEGSLVQLETYEVLQKRQLVVIINNRPQPSITVQKFLDVLLRICHSQETE